MPGCLDQEPAGVPGAGLGERSLAALLAGRVLRRDQSDISHDLPGVCERSKSSISAHSPAAVSVSMPRKQRNQPTCSAHGEPGSGATISRSSCSPAMHERVDRSASVSQRRLCCRKVQLDARKPRAVPLAPRRPVVKAQSVTQQQLRQAMTTTHAPSTGHCTTPNVWHRLILSERCGAKAVGRSECAGHVVEIGGGSPVLGP